jgi:hypothetical protein
MTFQHTAVTFFRNSLVARQSPSRKLNHLLFPSWVRVFGLVAAVVMLLMGCEDSGYDEPVDDFIVSRPSDLEIFIRRSSDEPFNLLEVGVTPFVDPIDGPQPYILDVSGVALSDGLVVRAVFEDIARAAFIDPLGERVLDTLIVCDCFVDYVVLRSPFLDVTISFD